MKRGKPSPPDNQRPLAHRKHTKPTHKAVTDEYIRSTLRFVDYSEKRAQNIGGVFRDFDEEWSE